MLIHRNVIIIGKVQGVFFRRTIKHEARRRGLSGFVANEKDGSVRIEIEGAETFVHEFISWLKGGAGEGLHSVGEVDVEDGPFQGLEGFEINE